MCSECINKELLNIKECDWIGEHLIVCGMFSNKRFFNSIINSFNIKSTVYISKDMTIDKIEHRNMPFYAFYDAKSHLLSQIMYPEPCNAQKTINYYESFREIINHN